MLTAISLSAIATNGHVPGTVFPYKNTLNL